MANAFIQTVTQTALAIGIPVGLVYLLHALPSRTTHVSDYPLWYEDFNKLRERGVYRFRLGPHDGDDTWIVFEEGGSPIHIAQRTEEGTYAGARINLESFQRVMGRLGECSMRVRVQRLRSRFPDRFKPISIDELQRRTNWNGR